MGIYDREYYRGETRGNLWLSGTAPVCRAIIIANVAIFVLDHAGFVQQGLLPDWFAARAGDIFKHGHVWELVTSTFLHASLMHLLGNMLFLWFVGREMEAMYGSKDFAAFYFSAAIISTLGWAALSYRQRESKNESKWLALVWHTCSLSSSTLRGATGIRAPRNPVHVRDSHRGLATGHTLRDLPVPPAATSG